MIDFELEPQIVNLLDGHHATAEQLMRPISRRYDEHEHEEPWQFWEASWAVAHNPATAPSEQPAASLAVPARLRTSVTATSATAAAPQTAIRRPKARS